MSPSKRARSVWADPPWVSTLPSTAQARRRLLCFRVRTVSRSMPLSMDPDEEGLVASRTTEFFERLGEWPDMGDRISKGITGAVRLDIKHEGQIERWFLLFEGGRVRVSKEERSVDLVMQGTRNLFDRLVQGQTRVAASMLRNELNVEGDMRLMMIVGRIFPDPPHRESTHPRRLSDSGGQREGK